MLSWRRVLCDVFQPMNSDSENTKPPVVWALIDDRAGNRSQCLGVADALGLDYRTQKIGTGPLAKLPNALLGASFAGLNAATRAGLTPPWPDLVIAAGRRTAPVARKIRRLGGGNVFLAQVMHPGAGAGEFGLIAQPRHDRAPHRTGPGLKESGDNVHSITGAPHRLTPERLAEEAERWRGRFDHLPKPWIALIVGGTTRRRKFTNPMARELGARASKMALLVGGSLLVTTSRRTGAAAEALIGAVNAPAHVHRWQDSSQDVGGEDNPYHGYLALANGVIVTGDSVSMCSEACAGTGPVHIYAPPALITPKHARLHAGLYEQGYARPLADTADGFETWSHPRLNPAREVAVKIRKRLGL